MSAFAELIASGILAAPPSLHGREAELLESMLSAYASLRCNAQRHRASSVSRDIAVIKDFLAFTGNPPWRWTEPQYVSWCEQIGLNRKLAVSTQRLYQTSIKIFLDYLVGNVGFRNDVRRLFGGEIVQICHPGNMIPHVLERELAHERPAFNEHQVTGFFSALDVAIEEASIFKGRDLRVLQRDKALFFTMYCLAGRSDEISRLTLNSFAPLRERPAFGDFGEVTLQGKGSRGSGKKIRTIPIIHPLLPSILRWYVDEIRPNFLGAKNANSLFFFLSERGGPVSTKTIWSRFQMHVNRAGLAGLYLCPHSLRHTGASDLIRLISPEAVKRYLGHAHLPTTMGYVHFTDQFVQQEVDQVIKSLIEDSLN